LCAPIVEETRIFEQEQKNKELEEDLEVAFNFLKKNIISIVTPSPQVIVISNSEWRLKFYFNLLFRNSQNKFMH
jgi:hypothetical protein